MRSAGGGRWVTLGRGRFDEGFCRFWEAWKEGSVNWWGAGRVRGAVVVLGSEKEGGVKDEEEERR